MKKITLSILTLIMALISSAQITITSIDLLDVGDSIQRAAVDTIPAGFEPGPAGPDQHWDFSNLVMDTAVGLSFIDPASTPYGSLFPGSNIAIEGMMVAGFGIEGWAYGTKNSSVFQIDGAAGSYDIFENIVVPFNPPEVMFNFPVNYLDSLEQATTIDIRLDSPEPAVDSIRVKVVSSVNSRVDAWGEIMTPTWTGDVLRFRDVRTIIDSAWAKILFIWIYLETNTTTTITYKYMANNMGYPIMQFNANQAGTEYSMVNYLLTESVGGKELLYNDELVFDIFPNPANHYVNIRNPKSEIRYSIRICDMFGRIMDELIIPAGQEESSLDVSAYPAGIYQLVLTAYGRGVVAKKFVVR